MSVMAQTGGTGLVALLPRQVAVVAEVG